MKPFTRSTSIGLGAYVSLAFLLSGCLSLGDKYKVRSEVHADGSVDRTIQYYSADTIARTPNLFGASASRGWTETANIPSDTSLRGRNFHFAKEYPSADSATAESVSVNPVFNIKSEFESQFRWFYTTLRYTDTYQPVIRFESMSIDDYFSEDDINYLNARALGNQPKDSVKAAEFEKKFDDFLTRIYFEEIIKKIERVMIENSTEPRWIDTLRAHRESFYKFGLSVNAVNDLKPYLTDSLHLPVEAYIKNADIEPKEYFENVPLFDNIEHTVVMPWNISNSNSLTVNETMASWELEAQYMLKPISLSAESRRINYWAIALTIGILVVGFMILRRR